MLSYTVRLGRGTYTETFAALLEAGGERLDVVVKKPRRGDAQDTARAETLAAWGRSHLHVEGPHLVAVLEVGHTDEGPYVIQERVEGATLGSVLTQVRKKKRSLRPSLALRVVAELASALQELHGAGQVHGRLDPDEVIISFEGEVRLGDAGLFQLAGLEADPVSASSYERPGRGKEPPSAADDLYALALIALEALIGAPLWTKGSLSLADVVKALVDMSPLAQAYPELARSLAPLLSRSLGLEGPSVSAEELGGVLVRLIDAQDARAKPGELGGFVRVITPLKTSDDAPTMVAGAAVPVETVDDNRFKVATVAVNADLLAFLERGDSKPGRPRGVSQGLPSSSVPRVPVVEPESSRLPWFLGSVVLVFVVILLSRC